MADQVDNNNDSENVNDDNEQSNDNVKDTEKDSKSDDDTPPEDNTGSTTEKRSAAHLPHAMEDETKPIEAPFPPRPIKKARTAYFIFADDKRAEIQAAHPGEGVAMLAKVTGQWWANLSVEDRATYQAQAAQERERVSKDLENWKAVTGLTEWPTVETNGNNSGGLVLPVARIRKICKLDPEVRGLSKEALWLVTKCAELATTRLGQEAVKVAQLQNRRTLLPDDVAQVCATREPFLFLRDDVKDLMREQQKKHSAPASAESSLSKKSRTKTVEHPTTDASVKPLTAYFASSSGS